MIRPTIDISEDVITYGNELAGVVRATVLVRRWPNEQIRTETVDIPIDEVDSLIAALSDARDEYNRVVARAEARIDGEELRGDQALDRMREEMAEARRLK